VTETAVGENKDILFECPSCRGLHFNISKGGLLRCNSYLSGSYGCAWKGTLDGATEAEYKEAVEVRQALIKMGWTPPATKKEVDSENTIDR